MIAIFVSLVSIVPCSNKLNLHLFICTINIQPTNAMNWEKVTNQKQFMCIETGCLFVLGNIGNPSPSFSEVGQSLIYLNIPVLRGYAARGKLPWLSPISRLAGPPATIDGCLCGKWSEFEILAVNKSTAIVTRPTLRMRDEQADEL